MPEATHLDRNGNFGRITSNTGRNTVTVLTGMLKPTGLTMTKMLVLVKSLICLRRCKMEMFLLFY